MQYVSRTHHYIGNRRQENNGLWRIGVPGQLSSLYRTAQGWICRPRGAQGSLRKPIRAGIPNTGPRMGATLRGHSETIGRGWSGTWTPCCPCLPCPMALATGRSSRVSSLSLVRYCTNDYSVPVAYGHREVQGHGYVGQVVISCGAELRIVQDLMGHVSVATTQVYPISPSQRRGRRTCSFTSWPRDSAAPNAGSTRWPARRIEPATPAGVTETAFG